MVMCMHFGFSSSSICNGLKTSATGSTAILRSYLACQDFDGRQQDPQRQTPLRLRFLPTALNCLAATKVSGSEQDSVKGNPELIRCRFRKQVEEIRVILSKNVFFR